MGGVRGFPGLSGDLPDAVHLDDRDGDAHFIEPELVEPAVLPPLADQDRGARPAQLSLEASRFAARAVADGPGRDGEAGANEDMTTVTTAVTTTAGRCSQAPVDERACSSFRHECATPKE